MKLCLISITASHYRTRIYSLIDKEIGCNFIFGKDNTTVKRMDTSLLKSSCDIENHTIWGAIYSQPGLTSLVKDYDVIINDLGILCLSAWKMMLLAKLRGQKVITWGHGWYGREGFTKKWLKRMYCGLADANMVYGIYARDLMVKNGFDEGKLYVIHNSLDYDIQLVLRNKMQTSEIYKEYFGNEAPVLLFIGRLTEVKKLDQIIEAMALLKDSGQEYNCVLVGDGPMRDNLVELAKTKGLEKNVWFYGACYDETENANLVYNADLCVAPGNIGLTAMHAMMFGCPCISHNDFPWQMPEFEAIQDGVTGCFFERDNIQSLADSIKNWFMKKTNARENVRFACFKEIDENWNPHKQVEIIKNIISKL